MAKLKVNKKILILIGVFLVLLGLLLLAEKTRVTNLIKIKQVAEQQEPQSTSDSPSAKSDFSAEDSVKQAGNTQTENKSEAIVADLQGSASKPGSTSGVKSASGEITVFSPVPNSEIQESSEIYGTTTLSRISYRLIDNINGVIATGELSVVNGKFAGRLSFASNATEARVDIFSTKLDGTEFSNIEIPLRIKL